MCPDNFVMDYKILVKTTALVNLGGNSRWPCSLYELIIDRVWQLWSSQNCCRPMAQPVMASFPCHNSHSPGVLLVATVRSNAFVD